MPTYVYRCIECEHEFDVFAKMSDHPRARKCPVCGGRAQRQISGGAGFLFKGEGFYITDYRSEEYRSKAKADSEPHREEPVGEAAKGKGEKAAEKESAPHEAGKATSSESPPKPDRESARKPSGRKGSRKPRDRTR